MENYPKLPKYTGCQGSVLKRSEAKAQLTLWREGTGEWYTLSFGLGNIFHLLEASRSPGDKRKSLGVNWSPTDLGQEMTGPWDCCHNRLCVLLPFVATQTLSSKWENTLGLFESLPSLCDFNYGEAEQKTEYWSLAHQHVVKDLSFLCTALPGNKQYSGLNCLLF